ncbi:MAG: RnfABCDGE type electron transport complex subunit G [Peptostreptococcaceae bacterium]
MNNIVKLGLNLFAICAVAALALGATNQITAPVIEERNIQANNESRQIVLPLANEFTEVSSSEYENIDNLVAEVYKGTNGSEEVGYTVKVLPKGYGGEMELIVGISKEGTVSGISIGNMMETPGLGAKAKEPAFTEQFNGKPATNLTVVKGGASGDNEISAISGATITSDAVTVGVNIAIELFNNSLNK